MARYNKKRARELQHDKFRDTTLSVFDRLGDRMEGHGRTILYAVAGLVALVLLAGVYSWWGGRKAQEATRALSRVIEIADATVTATPAPGAKGLSFTTEKDRAQRVVEESLKVEAKYGDPYKSLARYFRAANLLTVDRGQGINELEALTKSGDAQVAARSKFALAQAREADAQYDAAAALYLELARAPQASSVAIPADTANVRLAAVYEKQGKRSEAAEILFNIAKTAREAKGKDGKPLTQSAAARDATQKLERLDPARFAQLPAEPSKDIPL